jgi:Na+/H+ antiporter NhaA
MGWAQPSHRSGARYSAPVRGYLREFLREGAAGGVALMVAAALALAWANSPWRAA